MFVFHRHRQQGVLMIALVRACSAVIVAFFVCLVPVSRPQTETATVSGRITDESGGLVAGAGVELQSIDRGTVQQTKSNAAGIYSFPSVQPGQYHLTIRQSGFKAVEFVGLVVNVQDHIEKNFQLQLGSVAESVTVTIAAPLVNTEDASVRTVVDHDFVENVPLNGRSFQTLFQLTPGVVIASTSVNEEGQFNVNGQRANANYFSVDGVSANVASAAGFGAGQSLGGSLPALTTSGGTNGLVSVDALQEFAIQTSTYAPEYGRTPGGQISILTRSGTNEYHGDVFDYFRNDVLDANDWFANSHGLKKAALRQNDFGGVFGGPILRKRTFFFFSYEGLRLRQPTTGLSDVPSLITRQAAPASILPILNAFPLPTGPDEGNGLAPADYAFSNPSRLDAASIRIDHHIGDKVILFARYNRSTSETAARGAFESLTTVIHSATKLHTVTTGLTWSLRPSLTNDARFNWSWVEASAFSAFGALGGAQPLAVQSFLPSGQTAAATQFIVSIQQTDTSNLIFGPNSHNLQRQLNFVDSLSWQIHSHLVKVGVDYRRLTPQVNNFSYGQESDFGSVGDLIAGNPSAGVQITSNFAPVNATYNNYSIFSQDTWRAMPRLTLTYGLRWDYNPAPSAHGPNGLPLVAVVWNGTDSLANIAPAPIGTPLYHATADNFAPRLGIAYSVLDSPKYSGVIRTGFGVFYDLASGEVGNIFTGFPFSNVVFPPATTFPLTASEAAPPPSSLLPPFGNMNAYPSTLRQPYTYHWNFSWEQTIGSRNVFTASYVGAAGHSLLRQDFIEGPFLNPNFNILLYNSNLAYSKYNALQIEFRTHRTKGLNLLGSYTLAHSLDNVSAESGATSAGPTATRINSSLDYGNSDFDIRHTGSVAADYDIPTPAGPSWSRAILGGWGVTTFLVARSASPLSVTVARNIGFGFQSYRPNVVPGVPQYIKDGSAPGGRRLNPAAFSIPATPIEGDLGRNTLRGFPLFQQDLSLRRTFHLGEKLQLQARLEAFNVLNHPNFAPPRKSLGFVFGGMFTPNTDFGVSPSTFANGVSSQATGSGFNPLYQVGGPRSLQLALKLIF